MASSSSLKMSDGPRRVRPPDHLPPWHRSADLGYPDFLPPRPGQEEDSMADSYVKTGYVGKPIVATDSFTVHEMIHETWEKNGQTVLGQLGNLMSEVYVRRNKMLPAVGPSTFKAPDRRTVNEARKISWIADLANPNVPLSKLGNFVPPAPKGHDLLDMLESNKVSPSRAVWYVRVLGAADLQNMGRARNNFDSTPYTIDWTNNMTGYLKKQLGEIVLPRAHTGQSLVIKSTFKSVLSDPESRERWTSKFSYSLDLLRECYAESLVDHGTFLFWLSQQPAISNLAQLNFVIRLVDEYLEALLEHRGLIRPLVEGCILKMLELSQDTRKAGPQDKEQAPLNLVMPVANLLQRVFVAFPDTFVFPRLWTLEGERFLRALFVTEPTAAVPALREMNTLTRDLLRIMAENFEDVQSRNNAMLFRTLPDRGTLSIRTTMADIQKLNSISSMTDVDTVRFFETIDGVLMNQPSATFESKLDILLTWSVVSTQFGDHRPYLAYSLLLKWRHDVKMRSIRRHTEKAEYDLQESLFKWLDTSTVARDQQHNLHAVTHLYAELCRVKLFSYERLIRRVMARGEAAPLTDGIVPSHLMTVLRHLPLPVQALRKERATVLYGVFSEGILSEEATDRTLRRNIQLILPQLFNAQVIDDPSLFDSRVEPLLRASRFEQNQCIIFWLIPIITQRFESEGDQELLSVNTYYSLAEILRLTQNYPFLLEVNLRLLRQSMDIQLIGAVLETLRRHGAVWASMNELSNISEMLLATQRRLGMLQLDARPLLKLLNKAEFGIPLLQEDSEKLIADIEAHNQALFSPNARLTTMPIMIPEILQLSQNPDPAAPRNIARTLWSQCSNINHWPRTVWDNVFQGLCQVASATDDTSVWTLTAAKYLALLEEVANLLPIPPSTLVQAITLDGHDGIMDFEISEWFREGNGKQEFLEMEPEVWLVMMPFLLELVLRGIASVSALLRGLVYPAWAKAVSASAELESVEILVQAANTFTKRVLLMDNLRSNDYPGLPPTSLDQIQTLQTHRRRVYGDKNQRDLASLLISLPNLIAVELNENLREDLRLACTEIRIELCRHPEFRTVACREMEELREIFLHKARNKKTLRNIFLHETKGKVLEFRLADALRQIVNGNDGAEADLIPSLNWSSLSTALNEWEFSKATIELHLSLRHINSQMEHPRSKAKAEVDLQHFMSSFFGHKMTAQDTDILADVLYGITNMVAVKFLNHGVETLSQEITALSSPLSREGLPTFLSSASETLRLLALVLIPRPSASEDYPAEDHTTEEQSTDTPRTPPAFEPSVVDGFMTAIQKALTEIGKTMKPPATFEPTFMDPNLSDTVVLLCRILQFCLGFQGMWTSNSREIAEDVVGLLLRLALAFGGGIITDSTLFRLLVDTVSYLMDEIPKDSKAPNIDLTRKVPGVQLNTLPNSMPHTFRQLLKPLLTYTAHDYYSHNLVHIQTENGPDSNGDTGPPVQPRPWEWFDYTDPLYRVPGETVDDQPEDEIKNATSVSLEFFQARPTGEKLLVGGSPSTGKSGGSAKQDRVLEESRFLNDHLHQETMFVRHWKDSTVDLSGRSDYAPSDEDSEEEDDDDDGTGISDGISPAPTSSRSRTLDREIIDVDALPGLSEGGSGKGRKRKAQPGAGTSSTTTEIIDDDIEIVEPTANSMRGKRGRGRPLGSRGKGKRKSG